MKKYIRILTFILSLILIFSFSINAAEIKDVSKDHWAYKSVKELVDKGYLSLYEDGTFKGNNKVTRYELAELVARILDNIQKGKTEADLNDIETLRKLSLEFRDELVEIAEKQDLFSRSLQKLKEKNMIQNEDIAGVTEKVSGLENSMHDNVTKLKNKIASVKELNEELRGEIKKLNSKIENTTSNLDKLDKNLSQEVNESENNIENKINKNEKAISNLDDRLSSTEKEVSNIVDNIVKIKQLEQRIDALYSQISSLKQELNTVNERITQKDKDIKALKSDINDEIMTEVNDKHSVALTRISSLQNKVNDLEDKLEEYQTSEKKDKPNQEVDQKTLLIGVAAVLLLLGAS